jgi:autophagy-related protein 5
MFLKLINSFDRHWPIGLIYDNYTISSSLRASSRPASGPLKLTLHLASPPNDKLLLSPTVEACKQAFMGQLKEADFLRWGSTRRMTGLRKQEQDGIWDGIKERKFRFYLSACSHEFLR